MDEEMRKWINKEMRKWTDGKVMKGMFGDEVMEDINRWIMD